MTTRKLGTKREFAKLVRTLDRLRNSPAYDDWFAYVALAKIVKHFEPRKAP